LQIDQELTMLAIRVAPFLAQCTYAVLRCGLMTYYKLECGPVPNVMAALPNIGGCYIVFLDPSFLYDPGIPAIREHLRQKLAHLCLHGLAQNCDVKGKIWEWVVRCWPQRTCSYSWGCYLCATFGENRFQTGSRNEPGSRMLIEKYAI